MFPEDLELASDKFVFFTPCIGELRQLPKKYLSFYLSPDTLNTPTFFTFTDWLFLEEKTGINTVMRDLYSLDDFKSAIVEKTLLRLKTEDYRTATRWDLFRMEDSTEQYIISGKLTATHLIEALEAQLADIELGEECRALGSVSIIGTTLITIDGRLIDNGTHKIITYITFVDSPLEVDSEHTEERTEQFISRRGELKTRIITTIHRQQRIEQ